MAANEWDAFTDALGGMDTSAPGFPTSGDIAMICNGLDQMLTGDDPGGLRATDEALQGMFRSLLAGSGDGARRAVLDGGGDPDARRAYAMGVLVMAQAFASYAYGNRREAGGPGPG